MLISEGAARNNDTDRRLACSLAAVAGALNACAFEAVGFFSANMTGNVSLLSVHLSSGDYALGILFLSIVLSFIAGAAFSTLFIAAGKRRRIGGMYSFSVLLEAALLTGLGAAEYWLPPERRATTLVLGLSFLMGLQNAIVTQISEARVRTTHVSGMATDIGIACGLLLDSARGVTPTADSGPILARMRLHAATVSSFFMGGTVGVLVYRLFGMAVLFCAAAVLCLIASTGLVRLHRLTRNSTLTT